MGNIFSVGLEFGMKFITKFAVSKGTLWALGITVFLQLLQIYMDKYKEDKIMKENYVKFLKAMADKDLVSVKIKESAESQYNELNK
jgi:hypothetical protein